MQGDIWRLGPHASHWRGCRSHLGPEVVLGPKWIHRLFDGYRLLAIVRVIWWGPWGILKAHCVQAQSAQRRKGRGLPQGFSQTKDKPASQPTHHSSWAAFMSEGVQGQRLKSAGDLVKDKEFSIKSWRLYQLDMCLIEVTENSSKSSFKYKGI